MSMYKSCSQRSIECQRDTTQQKYHKGKKKKKEEVLNDDRNSKNKTKFGGAGVSQSMAAPFSSAHG